MRYWAVGLVLLLAVAPQCAAEGMVLTVVDESADVYVETDGSMEVHYRFLIKVRSYSTPMNSLRIVMPHGYSRDSLSLSVNGTPYQGVYPVSDTAVEVRLEGDTTPMPGETVELLLLFRVPKAVFRSSSGAYVSFTPAWWSTDQVLEVQSLNVRIHLPEDFLDYEKVSGSEGYTLESTAPIVLSWNRSYAPPQEKLRCRVDFPSYAVNRVYDPYWDLMPAYYTIAGVVAAFSALMVGLTVLALRKRRKAYPTPRVVIEGEVVNRSLEPYLVGVLLNRDRRTVAATLLYELATSGCAEVLERKPLRLKLLDAPKKRYLQKFIRCIKEGRVDPEAFQEFLRGAERLLKLRMRGYLRTETMDHYESVMEKYGENLKKGRRDPDVEAYLILHPEAEHLFREHLPEAMEWYSWEVEV